MEDVPQDPSPQWDMENTQVLQVFSAGHVSIIPHISIPTDANRYPHPINGEWPAKGKKNAMPRIRSSRAWMHNWQLPKRWKP